MFYTKWTIDPNKKPEIHSDIDIESYHNDYGSISSSWLKEGLKSMYKFLRYPFREKEQRSDASKIGTIVHTRILEPLNFSMQYHVLRKSDLPFPNSTMAKTENKEYVKKIKDLGKEIIDSDLSANIDIMYNSIIANELLSKYLSMGKVEQSLYWNDAGTGLPMKTRPDLFVELSNGTIVVLDIKTTESAYPNDFASSVARYNYPLQAAIQIDGVEAVTQKQVSSYFYIAIEKSYPFEYCIYRLLPDDIAFGRSQYREILGQILNCIQNDTWPMIGNSVIEKRMLTENKFGIVDLTLPQYYYMP